MIVVSHFQRPGLLIGLAIAALWAAAPAPARTLDAIKASGSIGLCAHPNSLPYASKAEELPGFQIELGRALAKELGVSLTPEWVVIAYQIPRTTCDLVLDMIVDRTAPPDFGFKLSNPYYRNGVTLAVPRGSTVGSFHDLSASTKVGVQTGSIVAMKLDQRRIPISIFGTDEDMLAALAASVVDAAAVTSLTAQYFNHAHPGNGVTILPLDESEPDLVWDVAVGMRRPDDKLRDAVNAAIDHLRGSGTIAQIYARYGIVLQDPK